jgi:hypothetical protein
MLAEIQRVFRDAAVVIAHHMRKSNEYSIALDRDMRAWSEGARGSSAIKAHSDVIILQERTEDERGDEIVHLGAFLKDGADVMPLRLMESDHRSYYWKRTKHVPERLHAAYAALVGKTWDQATATAAIINKTGVSRATGYRHLQTLVQMDLVVQERGSFRIKDDAK